MLAMQEHQGAPMTRSLSLQTRDVPFSLSGVALSAGLLITSCNLQQLDQKVAGFCAKGKAQLVHKKLGRKLKNDSSWKNPTCWTYRFS